MNTKDNMLSVLLVLSSLALFVLGSVLASNNIYDIIYFAFLVGAILKFVYLRKSHSSLD